MNWYISQRVVAVKCHSQGLFKRGDEFVVKGLRGSLCKCRTILIDIGMEAWGIEMGCIKCNTHHIPNPSQIHWFHETCFAPIESKPELSEHTNETIIEELEQDETLKEIHKQFS